MICLCCGKPIKNEEAASCGWHHSCIKHFFGTTRLPEITISIPFVKTKAARASY